MNHLLRRFLIGVIVAVLTLMSRGDEQGELTIDEIKKLKVKEIRKRLDERGQKCSGCVEKDEYVAKYLEFQHMPLVERKAPVTEDKAN